MREQTAEAPAVPTDGTTAQPSATVGPWSSYASMVRWNVAQVGSMLPLVVVVQAVLAAGIIVGFGLVIPDIDPATALYLSTGAPTVLLMVVGLVIVPQGVARARTDGTFVFLRTLPVPRLTLLLADLTVWLLVALPSVAVAVLVGELRFDLALSPDWPVLLVATVLVTVTATSVGYAVAVTLPPVLAQLVSQVLVFFVMLFSPLTFPATQLPAWFRTVHEWLPVQPAGDLLRAGLASEVYSADARDVAVLAVWCVVGVLLSLRALVRRG
ncbi:ABC transporter permease [Isoptericola halotolerans]|uniref:ABC-2 type transport system permease protein n=1 Tax=Isoptericola halotolerans TaxID=300560 RepID=A0ABX2A7P0_9MICO|nr:ABC transporter permease [Isoptericola halotolerans]NOV98887.1 ABC-2 type transport system permease protein [Isoptericola halotolerans]